MATDIDQRQLQQIQNELKSAGLSRRGFIDGIKALGLGFGAAVTLGVEGAKARTPDVSLASTNPALAPIIEDGRVEEREPDTGDKKIRTALYRRWTYVRSYNRYLYGRW